MSNYVRFALSFFPSQPKFCVMVPFVVFFLLQLTLPLLLSLLLSIGILPKLKQRLKFSCKSMNAREESIEPYFELFDCLYLLP